LVTLTISLLAFSASAVDAVRLDSVLVPETDKFTPFRSAPPSTRCQTLPLKSKK